MNIPVWASKYLRQDRVQMIEDAVVAAEKRTTGEIIPIIVRRSSTVGHVPVVMSLLLIVFWLAADHGFLGWGDFSLSSLVICVALVGVARILSRLTFFQRIFTSREVQQYQVNARAEIEFFEHGVHSTMSQTGVLLFVSLMERRVVVLADRAINEKYSPETWQEVCDILLQGIRNANMGIAFKDAIEKCADLLEKDFPPTGEPDQLANHVIIKE